jgi:hypothetical protein
VDVRWSLRAALLAAVVYLAWQRRKRRV